MLLAGGQLQVAAIDGRMPASRRFPRGRVRRTYELRRPKPEVVHASDRVRAASDGRVVSNGTAQRMLVLMSYCARCCCAAGATAADPFFELLPRSRGHRSTQAMRRSAEKGPRLGERALIRTSGHVAGCGGFAAGGVHSRALGLVLVGCGFRGSAWSRAPISWPSWAVCRMACSWLTV
jgi:hypothetical protein